MKRITIIGGGASGTLLAINLMKSVSDADVEINLVENRSRVGRGVAFGTTRESHLLNIPADRMGAYADDTGHFYRWLLENGHPFEPHDFVPRKFYGTYLREVFENWARNSGSGSRLHLVDDEAVDMSVNCNSAEVILRSGEILPSSRVVLAFGNFKPPHPNVPDLGFSSSRKYFQDPWNSALYETVPRKDSICIVGTGLSMVDVALHFRARKHKGKIYAISTRGLLPSVHKFGFTYPPFGDELKSMTRVTDMLRAVRRHMKAAESDSSDWRAVIDSLRPATPGLWRSLPVAEKRYFMQHLSRYWNVARHRMPESAANSILDMCEEGDLQILKGRLKTIRVGRDDRFQITYNNMDIEQKLLVDALVNCIGSEANFAKVDSHFVKALVKRGHIRNDELALGIAASPDGRVVNKDGKPSPVVFTLGTALKGTLWESVSIPEIRTQARDLAQQLAAEPL